MADQAVDDGSREGRDRRLTGLLLYLGVRPVGNSSPDSPEFLLYHWQEELGLYLASLILGTVLMVSFFPLVAIGRTIAGEKGYQAGLDVGIGVVAFGAAGALLHFIRYVIIRVYLRAKAGSWSRLAAVFGPEPGEGLQRVATSTDWDFLVQAFIAAAVAATALVVNP